MMKKLILAPIAALILLGGSVSPAQAAAPIRECGDPDGRGGGRNLTTRVWTCAQGRAIFRDWKRGRRWPRGVTSRERISYPSECRIVTDVRVTGRRGGNVARFQFHGVACGGD